MKQKFCILLLLLFSFYASFSQKTIRDYWDYKKTKIKEEVQMNAMGQGQGFYRSYYYRGGFKETGFFTNGKKTGLWSQYREGATKPWYQSNMIYSNGYQYKTMEKYWFEDGPDAGKLKEWKEWDVSKYREGGADILEGEFLKVKHVLYINTWNDDNGGYAYPIKYMMWYDLDIRETLPLEKRYYKRYNKNLTLGFQWVFTKTGDKIETKYDENGVLTEKNITNANGGVVANEVIVWSEANKKKLWDFYYGKLFTWGDNGLSRSQIEAYHNYTDNFINSLIEKITANKAFDMKNNDLQNTSVVEMINSCNEEFYPDKVELKTNYYESYRSYNFNFCWRPYDNDNNIDNCIAQSKKALSVNNNLIYCKLNLGLCYYLKNDSATAFTYYRDAIMDITILKSKFVKIYWLQYAIDDINRIFNYDQRITFKSREEEEIYSQLWYKSSLVKGLFQNELSKYQ